MDSVKSEKGIYLTFLTFINSGRIQLASAIVFTTVIIVNLFLSIQFLVKVSYRFLFLLISL